MNICCFRKNKEIKNMSYIYDPIINNYSDLLSLHNTTKLIKRYPCKIYSGINNNDNKEYIIKILNGDYKNELLKHICSEENWDFDYYINKYKDNINNLSYKNKK